MNQKTIVVTGSTDGIGKRVATKFAQENFQVILHGRNPQKLKQVQEEVELISGNQNILAFAADLSDLKAVFQLATDIGNSVAQIDVLINNAGVFKTATPTSKEGLDLRFVVNYLAPIVLTTQLIPKLNPQNARILNLSSAAQASVSLEALQGTTALHDQNAYAQSKLALTMWSFHLAKQLNHSLVIPVNPGSLLNTKMVQEAYGKYWSSADKGSNILYQLATHEKYENDTGKYFDNDKGAFSAAHPDAYDASTIANLLSATNKIIATYAPA